MPSAVSIGDGKRMLELCVPGHEMTLRNHFRFVKWRGIVYPTLPKHDMIHAGHVRKMARTFGILECAKTFLGIQ